MKYLVRIEKAIVGMGLMLATVFLFMNIVLRQLGSSSDWAEEAIRYIMIWITFIGSGICFSEGTHYGIDLILRVKNKVFQKYIVKFILVCSIVFSIFLLYYGWSFMMFAKESGQITASLRMPIWIVYFSMPLSALLSIIHLVDIFFRTLFNIHIIEDNGGSI